MPVGLSACSAAVDCFEGIFKSTRVVVVPRIFLIKVLKQRKKEMQIGAWGAGAGRCVVCGDSDRRGGAPPFLLPYKRLVS